MTILFLGVKLEGPNSDIGDIHVGVLFWDEASAFYVVDGCTFSELVG